MRLAVCNQKGGVGKTTLTLNLGGALAAAGEDVLVVDLDPQGHLTTGMGLADAYRVEDEQTLTDGLKDPASVRLEDLVRPHEEVDALPAHISMFALDQDLVSSMRSRERLSQLLEGADDRWDWIVVDCRPSLGVLTDNALLACRNVVIPVEAEETSKHAVDLLLRQISTLEDQFDVDVRERALVLSNVDYPLDGNQQKVREWFTERFGEHVPVDEIRQRAAIKRAWSAGHSVLHHDESCDQEDALAALANDLIAQGVADE